MCFGQVDPEGSELTNLYPAPIPLATESELHWFQTYVKTCGASPAKLWYNPPGCVGVVAGLPEAA